jgi:hypothetical protein
MSRFAPLIVVIVLLGATLLAGAVQGRITNRWGVQPSAQHAIEQLRPELPEECGSWKLREKLTMSPEACRILEDPTYFSRAYVHQQTGDEVTVFVLLGNPGPVAVHTPEVCYSSKDYSVSAARQKATVKLDSGESHDLWDLPMKANNPLRDGALRVYYAWSTGTRWEAAEHPRFSYGGLPHLYKIQMAVHSRPGSQAKDFDPAQDFLANFLPQLQPRLVEASRRGSASR